MHPACLWDMARLPSSLLFFFSEFKGQFFREDYFLEQLIYKGQIIAQVFQSYHLTLSYVCFIIWHCVFACVHLLFVSLNCMSGSFNIACLLLKTVWGGGMGVTHWINHLWCKSEDRSLDRPPSTQIKARWVWRWTAI